MGADRPGGGGFELEDEDPPRGRAAPRPEARSRPGARPGADAPPAGRRRAAEPVYDDEGRLVVSEATVSERLDPSAREASRPGILPDPSGWPLEALRYPLRGPGWRRLALAALVFGAADVLTVTNAFLGALLKVPLYVALLRWQTRIAAATATGEDVLPPPFVGADLETDALKGVLGVVLRLLLYLLPAALVAVQPFLATPEDPVLDPGARIGVAGLVALAFLLAPVFLLGSALAWPGIAWPWHAVTWLARGLWPCVGTGLSWAACVLVERLVPAWGIASWGGGLLLYGALRLCALALAVVGARGLGVLGRRYAL